jgi:sterol desaturase/sphingolipid hydroxylase (fatty acid hydroxylase superfamily)
MRESTVASLAIGFLILAAIFLVIERLAPGLKGQRVFRRGFWVDVAYWFFTPLVTRWISRIAIAVAAVLLALALGISFESLRNREYAGFGPIGALPLWLQGITVFVLGDFVGYWMHRLFHTGRWWRFHAVHHSSTQVDWLSSVRLHPVNDAATRLVQIFPLFLLGFNPFVLVACAPLISLYAILLHANVNWDFGPLRAVIASPVFHRWHHTKEHEAMDKNFAGFFPFWDIVFGTYYLPRGKVPTDFGIHEPMPENLLGQLAFPFRRQAVASRRGMALQSRLPGASVASR